MVKPLICDTSAPISIITIKGNVMEADGLKCQSQTSLPACNWGLVSTEGTEHPLSHLYHNRAFVVGYNPSGGTRSLKGPVKGMKT